MSLRNDKLTWNHHKEVASLKTIREREDGILEGLKQISDRFEITLRNVNLSWNRLAYARGSIEKARLAPGPGTLHSWSTETSRYASSIPRTLRTISRVVGHS